MKKWLLPLLLVACDPLELDPFLYDPMPAPAGGYTLPTAVIPKTEDLFITTPDGERVHAVLAPGRGPRSDITLVYFHGQSNNIGSSWSRVELLYPLGYQLVAVDPRGYGRSTGTPSEPGIRTDLLAVHEALLRRPDVRADRLVYYGRSFGGALAITLAADRPPAVLITESAFTSIAAMVRDGAYADLPRTFVASAAWDNLAKIRTISRPYLALHGTADPYVQFRYGQELVAAHQGTDQLVPVRDADHGDVPDRLGHEAYRATIARFVDAHVAGP